LSQTDASGVFQAMEIPVDKIALRPGAGVPGGDEQLAKKILGDLVRGGSEPIFLRPAGPLYEVIAGDAEYLAARRRGAATVKVMVGEMNGRDALLLRLREGSRRGDLNPVEEAEIIRELNKEFGMTQQEIAMRCGKVQSTIANKVRLLKLPQEVLESLRRGEMGERHARALLKIEDPAEQVEVFRRALKARSSAAEIESMCALRVKVPKVRRRRRKGGKGAVKDLRIYQNSLRAVVREMKEAGLSVTCDEDTPDKAWEFRVLVKTEET